MATNVYLNRFKQEEAARAAAPKGMFAGGQRQISLMPPSGSFTDPEGNLDLMNPRNQQWLGEFMDLVGPEKALQYMYLGQAGIGGNSLVNQFGGIEELLGLRDLSYVNGVPTYVSGGVDSYVAPVIDVIPEETYYNYPDIQLTDPYYLGGMMKPYGY